MTLSCSNHNRRYNDNRHDKKQETTNSQIPRNDNGNNADHKDIGLGSSVIPNESVIANDLIGRKITEGRENGYFNDDWLWTIEYGEISNLKILSQTIEEDYCSFLVEMVLKAKTRPIRYKVTVRVDYTLINNRWVFGMVKSIGVDVVKTGRYDDCISTQIADDGWGGVNCLKITNNTDVPLFVGGLFRTNSTDAWRKFSSVVEGHQIIGIGGTFGGGSVVDYEIHFVEQY